MCCGKLFSKSIDCVGVISEGDWVELTIGDVEEKWDLYKRKASIEMFLGDLVETLQCFLGTGRKEECLWMICELCTVERILKFVHNKVCNWMTQGKCGKLWWYGEDLLHPWHGMKIMLFFLGVWRDEGMEDHGMKWFTYNLGIAKAPGLFFSITFP